MLGKAQRWQDGWEEQKKEERKGTEEDFHRLKKAQPSHLKTHLLRKMSMERSFIPVLFFETKAKSMISI